MQNGSALVATVAVANKSATETPNDTAAAASDAADGRCPTSRFSPTVH